MQESTDDFLEIIPEGLESCQFFFFLFGCHGKGGLFKCECSCGGGGLAEFRR